MQEITDVVRSFKNYSLSVILFVPDLLLYDNPVNAVIWVLKDTAIGKCSISVHLILPNHGSL